jgi:hypothetical protein
MGHPVERMRVLRLQPERLLVVRQRLLVTLEQPGGVAAVEQRIDVVALDRQRLVVAGDRLLVALERQQGGAAVGESLDMIRGERQGPVIARDRVLVAIEQAQRVAAIAERLHVVGVERERAVIGGDGVAGAFEAIESGAETVVGIGRARMDLDRLGEKLQRFVQLALMVAKQPEEMQPVEIIRILLQQAGEKTLGFGGASLALALDRLFERAQRLQESRVGGRKMGHAARTIFDNPVLITSYPRPDEPSCWSGKTSLPLLSTAV